MYNKSKKGFAMFKLFKIIVLLALDAFLLYGLISFGDEAGGYIFLLLAIVAWLTWELVRAIKE
jgi:hypothetical protein